MLNKERLNRVLKRMDDMGIDEMLITDPLSVYYLTGKMVHSGERFFGLAIGNDMTPVLFLNELFQVKEDLGVDKVYFKDTDDLMSVLIPHLKKVSVLGVDKIMPARFLLPMMEQDFAERIVNGSEAVDFTRAVKDSDEIEKMREASRINDLAVQRFKKLVHEGVTEKEIAAQTLDIYRELGASGFSFPPIISFGINACDPHHMPDDTVLKEGDVVLFDVGCVKDGYCSDMTRTYFYKKVPNEEMRRVYELVKSANEEAEKILKPGIPIHTIDDKARGIITDGGFGPYFTHRLGHFIGMEDHEYGDVSSTNLKETEIGNIFSIEPGIYDPKTCGVRIEDLVLITEEGYENLNHLSKELEIIE